MESHQETKATADTSSAYQKADGKWKRNDRNIHDASLKFLNPRKITLEEENTLLSDDSTPDTLDNPIKPFIQGKVKAVIKYDKISESKESAKLLPHN